MKFHDIVISVEEKEKIKRGKASKNTIPEEAEIEYQLKIESTFNEKEYEKITKKRMCFHCL